MPLSNVANEGGITFAHGVAVEQRSVGDLIQQCPFDGCGWFELRNGVPSWPPHPMGGTNTNITHLIAAGAKELLYRDFPGEHRREIAVQDKLATKIREWESELKGIFPAVQWEDVDLDDVIAEVWADEALQPT